jgi:hypothetical protein
MSRKMIPVEESIAEWRKDPDYARATTSARGALVAFAEAWTYPIRGNEDVPVSDRLFEAARRLAKDAVVSAGDPPEFKRWLEILRDEPRKRSLVEWEDTLHAVTDYLGLSTDI